MMKALFTALLLIALPGVAAYAASGAGNDTTGNDGAPIEVYDSLPSADTGRIDFFYKMFMDMSDSIQSIIRQHPNTKEVDAEVKFLIIIPERGSDIDLKYQSLRFPKSDPQADKPQTDTPATGDDAGDQDGDFDDTYYVDSKGSGSSKLPLFIIIALVALSVFLFWDKKKSAEKLHRLNMERLNEIADLKLKHQTEIENLRKKLSAPQPKPKHEDKPAPKPEPEPRLEPRPEPKPEPKPTPKPEPRPEPKPKKIRKYGQIAIPGANELVIEDDYLSDQPADMPFTFDFEPDMSAGTYDINDSVRSMYAADTDFIKPFVNNFDSNPNASRLVTVSPGKFRRKGASWEVVEKITIALK